MNRFDELAWDAIHADMVRKYAFFIHYVPGDDQTPYGVNIHTHGLPVSLNHPDLQIVLPISQEVALSILHTIVDWIKKGNRIEVGKHYDFIGRYDSVFAWAVEGQRDVLRLIIPDRSGHTEKEKMTDDFMRQWVGTLKKRKGLSSEIEEKAWAELNFPILKGK